MVILILIIMRMKHGEVIVTAENVPFVTSAQVTEMGTRQVDNSALLIPIW